MIYHFNHEKDMAGRKTKFLLALLTKKIISLLITISITLKITKMNRNKPPFALIERTKSALILALLFSPLYYHVVTEEMNKKQPKAVGTEVNDSIVSSDTTNVKDREKTPVLRLHSLGE